jgi:hypothetical protein
VSFDLFCCEYTHADITPSQHWISYMYLSVSLSDSFSALSAQQKLIGLMSSSDIQQHIDIKDPTVVTYAYPY